MTFIYIFILAILAVFFFFPKEIKAIKRNDPAARSSLEIVLLYPGLHAIVAYRIAHAIHRTGVPFIPRAISQIARFLTHIEIHPGARIGEGFFIDHGTGVVVGETTIIGKNVMLFQGVTLGGTGKETGKRHPTLEDNVVVGAGAKVLGNITIGSGSYIGANAVVIKSVPGNSTVVGVPGRITKQDGKRIDMQLDHVHVSDPVMQNMSKLLKRIKVLEEKAGHVQEEDPSDDYHI